MQPCPFWDIPRKTDLAEEAAREIARLESTENQHDDNEQEKEEKRRLTAFRCDRQFDGQ
jgi:hypothetical protein